ncbi:protein Smaug homolog 1 [Aplysia californica]|uniref:Protein Smaug homolog 1 n=1 Tax=Aplysia californica TaxID=6500 RepID=A0ABM0K3Y9_APLCA|nr:protein Smaug homolog 1 [Aplysia californica]
MALRATNSHAGAFGASHGHIPLHATSSAPSNFNSMPPSGPIAPQGPSSQQQNTHAPLRRTHSITPPVRLQTSEKAVSDWLKTNHGHHHHLQQQQQQHLHHQPSQLQQLSLSSSSGSGGGGGHAHPILASRSQQYPDHAPLSPQSSVTSSGSGGSDGHQEDGPQPMRDSFLEEGSGMREVPVWLKTLRLHKYSYLFRQMTYEEMLSVTEDWLEQQNVTKGARHKIYVSISKLRERQDVLRSLEKNIVDEGGSINSALGKMKEMLNTPIKAFNPAQSSLTSNNPAYRTTSSSSSSSTTSSLPQSPSADEVLEGDLPAQFCRLMGKVCTQLLVASRPDDECFKIYLQLIDKCLNHEAFSDRQKKLLQSWKQSAQKIWQPSPQRYGDRPRRSFANTFHVGNSLGGRIIPRAGRIPVPQSVGHHQQHPSMQQWSFGSKRSILGGGSGGGHMPVQRNNSLNTAFLNKPGLLEQTKQPISRTHSAPTNRPMSLPMQGCENANDTEINARLDSLCISMTEHALGSSDTSDRGPNY